MRLVSFATNGRERIGIRRGGKVVDVTSVDDTLPDTLLELITTVPDYESRLAALSRDSDHLLNLDEVTLLPPIGRPGKILCLGLNYVEHAREGGFEIPESPVIFMRSATSLIGPNESIVRPACSDQLDYEAELAVVIGRRAKHLKRNEALDAVAGYSAFNDASVRDYQRKTHQWTLGKNFDGTGAFGPELVTIDELPTGGKGLEISTRLNGQVVQKSNTDNMIFEVAETLEVLSEVMTLEPGDVVIMGTPPGVGHARTPQLWMKPGDVCEVNIEHIGRLRNTIVAESM